MKTIQIKDETYKFLKKLQEELVNQDNRGTSTPTMCAITEEFTEMNVVGQDALIVGKASGDEVFLTHFIPAALDAGEFSLVARIAKYMQRTISEILTLREDQLRRYCTEELVEILHNQGKSDKEYKLVYTNQVRRITEPLMFLTEKACRKYMEENDRKFNFPATYIHYMGHDKDLAQLLKFIKDEL